MYLHLRLLDRQVNSFISWLHPKNIQKEKLDKIRGTKHEIMNNFRDFLMSEKVLTKNKFQNGEIWAKIYENNTRN